MACHTETRRGVLFTSSQCEEVEPSQLLDSFGVGIDTHSRFIQVCVLVRDGQQILRTEREWTTDWPALCQAKAWVQEVLHKAAITPEPLHYCIESTGTYHVPVLLAWEGAPRVVNPVLTGSVRRKTDVLDARTLAYQDITGLWPASFIPDSEVQEVRVLLGERARWVRARIKARNRINNVLLRFGHTIFAYAKWGSYTRAAIEDLVEGRLPDGPGICPRGIPECMRPVLKSLLEEQEHADEQAARFLKAALDRAKAIEWVLGTGELVQGRALLTLLQSTPGIGEISALTWLAQVVWPGRFANPKACAAFCGCDPSLKISAGKVTSYTRRHGNKELHRALIQAAGSLISRKSEPFGRWGHRISKKHTRGGYKRACGAVARRLAQSLYYVHIHGEPFTYESYTFWQTIEVPELPIEEMDLGRFTNVLKRLDLTTSKEVAAAYQTTLSAEKGVGTKCLQAIEQWLKTHGQASISRAPSSDERKRTQQARLRNAYATRSSSAPKPST